MDFELATFDAAALAQQKCDVLLVLVGCNFKSTRSVLDVLIAQASKSGALGSTAGSLLDIYRPTGLKCNRLVLLQTDKAAAQDVRKALSNAMTLLKAARPGTLGLHFRETPQPHQLRAAMLALADSSYTYTHTKTKAEARSIKRVVLFMPDPSERVSVFEHCRATIRGIEVAKEWGNRPANHATPRMLAQAARKLASAKKIKCEILNAKAVAKLGMGV